MRDNSAQWFEYDWPLDGAMARFGADMAVESVNDGPVTLIVDTKDLK